MKFINIKNTTDALDIVPISNTCKWDWTFTTQKSIGRYTAPIGYTYIIVIIYLENESNQLVSTWAKDWNFIADKIVYNYDSATLDNEINHISTDVCKGGKFTTKIVYLVTDNVERASLCYSRHNAPQMEGIEYFSTIDEIVCNAKLSSPFNTNNINYTTIFIILCIIIWAIINYLHSKNMLPQF